MITITDRRYNAKCQLTFDNPDGLIAYDDWFEQDLDTGVGTLEFSVDKDGNPEIEKITVGSYVFVRKDSRTLGFEIVSIEEDNSSKTVYCEDGGLDLLGETVPPLEGVGALSLVEHFDKATYDSGWEIGINDVPEANKRTIETEGFETAVKRLRRIAKAFDAEMDFSYDFINGRVSKKKVNFYRRIGRDKKVRLEYGANLSKITKKESIERLATGLRARGADGLTIEGYKYDDGRYVVESDRIYDRQEGKRWSRHADGGGYIVDTYESEAKTKERLFQETLRQLKKRAYPEVTYEVDISYLPEELEIGDSVGIVDATYQPALFLEARVSKIKTQLSNRHSGQVSISNITEKKDRIDERLSRLSYLVKERLFDFTAVPFVMELTSSHGTIFKDGSIDTTLKAKVTKMSIDHSERFSYRWSRISSYDKTGDASWIESKKAVTGASISISAHDVDREALFVCEAFEGGVLRARQEILIKDFTVGRYVGTMPPARPETGDLWTDTSKDGQEVLKIYTGGQWKPVVERHEVEQLQADYQSELKEIINNYLALTEKVEQKIADTSLTDLTGKYADLEAGYQRLREKAEKIEGLGERVTAFELNLEQSKAVIKGIDTYFKFQEEGFTINKEGSPMMLKMANDRIEFLDGGKPVAEFTNQRLRVLSGAFVESILIGNHKYEKLGDEWTVISYVGGL